MEKIQLIRSTEVQNLTEEEYAAAMRAVEELREVKKIKTEILQMSSEDAIKASSAGAGHGDPFFVVR